MIQIRYGTFETNSSSTHSITMCLKSEYDSWRNGEVYLNESWCGSKSKYKNKKFVTKEEVIDILVNSNYPPKEDLNNLDEEEFNEILKDEEFYTFDNYGYDYLDSYEETYTTPGGETIVAFGQYGHD